MSGNWIINYEFSYFYLCKCVQHPVWEWNNAEGGGEREKKKQLIKYDYFNKGILLSAVTPKITPVTLLPFPAQIYNVNLYPHDKCYCHLLLK